MIRYIVRRLLATVAVVWGVSILLFSIISLTPGDAARAQLPAGASPDQYQRLRDALGLDEPIPIRYSIWLRNTLRGDFGLSYQHHIPARDIVGLKFKNTLVLASSALLVSVTLGLITGVVAGTRPNSTTDRVTMTIGITGASIPTFWLGIVLLLLFSLKLGWFPAVGMRDVRGEGGVLDVPHHLVLPTIAAAAVPAAIIARQVRSAVLEIINLDYIRTARAKGLSEREIVRRHVLKNALPSFITIVALQAGYLLGGTLVTEIIFSWPGMGLQLYTSVGARDIPVIMTIAILVAVVFTSLNLLADILQGIVDPRVRLT
jgi:peptide/nickel transport system permease protein